MSIVLAEDLVPGCLTLFGDSRGPAVAVDIQDLVLTAKTTLYLSKVEVSEVARPFGFLPPDHVEELRSQLQAAKDELANSERKLIAAEEALAAWRMTAEIRESEMRAEVRRLEAEMDEMEIRTTKKTAGKR